MLLTISTYDMIDATYDMIDATYDMISKLIMRTEIKMHHLIPAKINCQNAFASTEMRDYM